MPVRSGPQTTINPISHPPFEDVLLHRETQERFRARLNQLPSQARFRQYGVGSLVDCMLRDLCRRQRAQHLPRVMRFGRRQDNGFALRYRWAT